MIDVVAFDLHKKFCYKILKTNKIKHGGKSGGENEGCRGTIRTRGAN